MMYEIKSSALSLGCELRGRSRFLRCAADRQNDRRPGVLRVRRMCAECREPVMRDQGMRMTRPVLSPLVGMAPL